MTFLETRIIVNWNLHFIFRCHINIICLVVCVISISKVLIDVWVFFTNHTTFQNLNYVCPLTCSSFLRKFLHVKYQKLAKTIVEHTHWWGGVPGQTQPRPKSSTSMGVGPMWGHSCQVCFWLLYTTRISKNNDFIYDLYFSRWGQQWLLNFVSLRTTRNGQTVVEDMTLDRTWHSRKG
jgi:hypothetical protein